MERHGKNVRSLLLLSQQQALAAPALQCWQDWLALQWGDCLKRMPDPWEGGCGLGKSLVSGCARPAVRNFFCRGEAAEDWAALWPSLGVP